MRKGALKTTDKLIREAKANILEVFYQKELYKRLLYIVTEDPVSTHRETALDLFTKIIEKIENLSEETTVVITSIAQRMNKAPFAEP